MSEVYQPSLFASDKFCTGCDSVLPVSDFGRRAKSPDGLKRRCKVCSRREAKARYWTNVQAYREYARDYRNAHPELYKEACKKYRAANLEERRAQSREYGAQYRATPEGKAKAKANDAAYYQRNAEKVKARVRAYKDSDPEAARERDRQWKKANPDKVRALNNKRRARKRDAEGSHTAAEWDVLCEAHGHRCAGCREARPLTRDHIVPLSKGGSDAIENIQPLCIGCNTSKGDRLDWRPKA